jgi:hypothetical protein
MGMTGLRGCWRVLTAEGASRAGLGDRRWSRAGPTSATGRAGDVSAGARGSTPVTRELAQRLLGARPARATTESS